MTEQTQAEALRKEYRATMPHEVLHLWAKDALACIAELEVQAQPAREPLAEGKLRELWAKHSPYIGAPFDFAHAITKEKP